jgi:hypothetical protein
MKPSKLAASVAIALAASTIIASCARTAQEPAAAPATDAAAAPATASAPAATPYPARVFFGDTHLHTALSLDAGAGGTKLMPEDAYRFAKGEEVTTASGQKARLSRPLDFLVVADHSDQMGLITDLIAGKPEILANPMAKGWYDQMNRGKGGEAMMSIVTAFGQGKFPKEIMYNPGSKGYGETWQRIIQAAEGANQPGKFTAFIGYEWTSLVAGNNLHRNVIFRDNADKASQVEPFHQLSARQLQSARPVEVDAGLRGQDRRAGAGDRAQRQPQQRHDVPADRVLQRQADRPRVRRDAREARAPVRSHADEGRWRDPSRTCRRTTSSPTTSAGTRATST